MQLWPYPRAFGRMYFRLATLVGVGVVMIGLCLLMAYWVLKTQWEQYAVSQLEGERGEVQVLLQHAVATGNYRPEDLIDDSGEHMSFAVFQGKRTVLESASHPLPANVLLPILRGPSVAEMKYADAPYRLYHDRFQLSGQAYDVVLYQMTGREHTMLERARDALLVSGVIGAAASTLISLRLAWTAMSPLRRSWAMQREWLLELSHELQTPLAVARASIATPDAQAAPSVALQAIDDASALVRDIVYLSQLSTLPDSSTPEPVPVSEVTEETVAKLQPWAQHRAMQVTGHVQPGLFISTTTERWARLISLLVKNAIDHSPPGSTVSWQLTAEKGRVVFTVRNSVAERHLPTRSFRASAPPMRKRGVGLTIAERLAQDMGGTLTLRQEDDRMVAHVSMPMLRSR